MVNDPVHAAASAPFPEIPGYRLESVLGRGATGTVYRAVQVAVERVVALKVLHPELAGSKAVKRLQREARTTARLAHPGIVSAIDMGQVGGLWWYAMELIDGPSLSALLREKGRLSERDALKLFIPLCEALEHAHEHGVVHRDIKPANILVDVHGRARLVDLGLAFTEDDPLLTRTGGTLGTPHYLSPEQARNPQAVDVRSDLWSLGASMYHALCGRPPFAGESVAEILSGVLYAHIAEPRELEPTLSLGMSLVLRKCLTRNADKRYSDPSELLRDLEALRERRAVRVSVRSLDPVAGEKERRRRNVWIAAGAALVVALIGLFAWRPWAVPPPTNGVPVASDAPWEQLEEILAASRVKERRALGDALSRLEALRDSEDVPLDRSKAYWVARGELRAKFESAVREERKHIVLEYDKALRQERDFQRAFALVSPETEKRIARELGTNEQQRLDVTKLLAFGDLREQVEADEKIALEKFSEQINVYYDTVVVPKVQDLQASGKWVSARDWIQRDIAEVLDSAGLGSRGLSAAKVAAELARLRRYKVDGVAHAIEEAWRIKDAELMRAVNEQASAIKSKLESRELREDAGLAVEAAYASTLAANSIAPEQMLCNVADLSHEALRSASKDLKQLQESLLIQDAEAELKSTEEQLAGAWRDRQYADIASTWKSRLGDEWLKTTHARVELRMQEAALLQTLLTRAADGVRAPGLDSILVGSIPRPGKIVVGADPLRDGFQLAIGGTSEVYALRLPSTNPAARLLGAGGLEKLAGLAGDPKDDLEPLDRLARALFRMREGEADVAFKVFNSGPLPRESHNPLIQDLESRLHLAHGELFAKVKQREDDAQQAYNLIQRDRVYAREAQDRVKRINDLLTQFPDTEFVREHDAQLRELRASIEKAGKQSFEDRLRAAFGDEIRFPGNARAQLEFRCGVEPSHGWEMGDWNRGNDGWTAPRRHSRAELENEALWPRLRLDDSLDLARMTVEIEFEQRDPPRFFVASVAGVHLGFAGFDVGLKPQFAAKAGGPDELKALLEQLDKQKGTPISGLQRGKRYKLRVELQQNRGRLTAYLNDEQLPGGDYLRPEGRAGSYSIVLRSLEPVLLLAVRVEVGVRK
ncbi:MAG TPA: serine/threonine-protein kinase [Planctomycetota bacterium]|nr:serine/threonine-protein kinase [Planctomycetota bacterium]